MDEGVLASMRPAWRQALSRGGGRGHQHVGFWWDPTRMKLIGEPREFKSLAMGGRVRPGLLAEFESVEGLRFAALVVHLKAKSDGQELRREQWQTIASIARKEANSDLPLVVLGDFNSTGSPQLSAQGERAAMQKVLGTVGLELVTNSEGCSAYWQGAKRDAWLEASLLDLVWTRGFAPTQAWPGAHCGIHSCERFRSTRTHPDLDYRRVSDHCPIVVDLHLPTKPQK
jgi:endonuclease/exonuclease/phosphatase family metal-dependent hydrolase